MQPLTAFTVQTSQFPANQQFKFAKRTLCTHTRDARQIPATLPGSDAFAIATKMQMHVIITRRASSENLDAKELRFLSLGRSSSSCNETPRIVAGGRPKSGGRRLENKKKKKKKETDRDKRRIRRWRVEKDPAKIMKLLYANMYFPAAGAVARVKKELAAP